MTGSMDVINEFVNEGVFPRCRNEYLNCEREYSSVRNNFSLFCSNVMKNNFKLCNNPCRIVEFSEYCQNLGLYLYCIKRKEVNEKKRNCLFFFYSLKDMMNKYHGTCSTAKECYDEMRKEPSLFGGASIRFDEKIDNTCDSFVESNHINDDIFNKLQDLEELHNINEKYKGHKIECNFVGNIINEYNKILCKYNIEHEKADFKQELNKFHEEYSKYVQKNEDCKVISKNLNEMSEKAPVTPAETFSERVQEAALVTDAALDAWKHIGTGVGVFTVVILINMFLLYKVKNKFNLLND